MDKIKEALINSRTQYAVLPQGQAGALLAHTYMDVGGRATQDAKAEARIQSKQLFTGARSLPLGYAVFTSTTTKVLNQIFLKFIAPVIGPARAQG